MISHFYFCSECGKNFPVGEKCECPRTSISETKIVAQPVSIKFREVNSPKVATDDIKREVYKEVASALLAADYTPAANFVRHSFIDVNCDGA